MEEGGSGRCVQGFRMYSPVLKLSLKKTKKVYFCIFILGDTGILLVCQTN